MNLSPFLRTILCVDGISSIIMALVALAFSSSISVLTGLSYHLAIGLGLILTPIGLFIFWLGSRQIAHEALIALVIGGNFLWTLMSLVAVLSLAELTEPGEIIVFLQGIVVAAFALLEWFGLYRLRNAVRCDI